MSATLHGAYDLARAGYTLTPNYVPTEDGCSCGCTDLTCRNRGKHPIGGDSKHATASTRAIKDWPKEYRAGFNVGIQLEISELVDIAPDCPEREAEFRRRGLPPGALSWRSGSGDGHTHYVYRRPAGCPVTKINKPGDFDIMAIGMAVAPPSVSGKGPYTWESGLIRRDDLPEAPAWAVAMLIAQGEKQARTERRSGPAAGMSGDDDEPPIQLSDAHDYAVWEGRYPRYRKGGQTIDRNASLLKIARVLYDNGMTRRGLVAELEARDHALGYHKFCCGRKDASTRYHSMVDELETTGRQARGYLEPHDQPDTETDTPPASASDCSRCEDLQQRLTACRRESRRVIAGVRSVLQDQDLTPGERLAAIAISFTVAAKEPAARLAAEAKAAAKEAEAEQLAAAGKVKQAERMAKMAIQERAKAGSVPVYAPVLAREAGLSRRAFDTSVQKLARRGIIAKHTGRIQQVTPNGPVSLGEYKSELRLALPGASIAEKLQAVVAAEKEERAKPGGWRPPRCPDCQTAAVLAQTTYVCAGCGGVTYRTEATVVLGAEETPLDGKNGHDTTSSSDGTGRHSDDPGAGDALHGHNGDPGTRKDPRDGWTTCALCKKVSREEMCEDYEQATGQSGELEPTWAKSGRDFREGLVGAAGGDA